MIQVQLERDTDKYLVNGRRVPSVTEVLQMVGAVNFSAVPPRLLEEAAARGRMVHRATAEYDLDGDSAYWKEAPPEIKPYIDAYIRFRQETDFKPLAIEQTVVNEAHRYAGTLDRIGLLNRGETLVDIKTGWSVAAWVGLQLAGYAAAIEVQRQPKMGRLKRFALRLKPDGTYSLHPFTDRRDRVAFLSMVNTAHWLLEHGGYTL